MKNNMERYLHKVNIKTFNFSVIKIRIIKINSVYFNSFKVISSIPKNSEDESKRREGERQ